MMSMSPLSSPATTSMSSLSFPVTPAGLFRQGLGHALALPLKRLPATMACCAFNRDQYSGGALVDENMAALRRRIREAQMAETNYEAPAGWAEWEKRYYPVYVSDVSGIVGVLQVLLMDTRPSVAIAVTALVLASVPVSAFAALHQLAQVAETVLQNHIP